jgi:hypothetical protein
VLRTEGNSLQLGVAVGVRVRCYTLDLEPLALAHDNVVDARCDAC